MTRVRILIDLLCGETAYSPNDVASIPSERAIVFIRLGHAVAASFYADPKPVGY